MDMDDTVYNAAEACRTVQYRGSGFTVGDNRISIEIPGVNDANAILGRTGTAGFTLLYQA